MKKKPLLAVRSCVGYNLNGHICRKTLSAALSGLTLLTCMNIILLEYKIMKLECGGSLKEENAIPIDIIYQ